MDSGGFCVAVLLLFLSPIACVFIVVFLVDKIRAIFSKDT